MNWDHIGRIIEVCQRDLDEALRIGARPHPVGMIFVPSGVQTVHRHDAVKTLDDLNSLAAAIRHRTQSAGAAGFLTMMPRSTWTDITGERFVPLPGGSPLDFVVVIHVEHLTDGAKTWFVGVPNLTRTDDWQVYRSGIHTKLPQCIDNRRYGPTRGIA